MVWGVFVSYNGLAISVYKYSSVFHSTGVSERFVPWCFHDLSLSLNEGIWLVSHSQTPVQYTEGMGMRLASFQVWCIAGNFRGRKLLWISQFCGYSWKFSLRNLASFGTAKATTKLLSVKIIFFNNSRKFSPSKVSRYMVVTWEALARMWVRPCL